MSSRQRQNERPVDAANKPVRVILAGLGGFGHTHLAGLLDQAAQLGTDLVAGLDPAPERCRRLADLQGRGIPVFETLEEALDRVPAELVILSTPIYCHAPQSILAVDRGLDVLCEKPLAATLDEARRMREAEQRTGRFIAIGYQWSYSDAIQRLKVDIAAGMFGRPLRFRTVVCWPRGEDYFGRNDWAGRLKTADGHWVLDSPVSNATAHYLHNMLYLLGPRRERSADPVELTAELYRANPIETFDTAALRLRAADGVELLFLTTHAVRGYLGPVIHYAFEEADIHFDSRGGVPEAGFCARFRDGRVRRYGNPDADLHQRTRAAAAAVRTRAPLACTVATATPHVCVVEALRGLAAETREFPAEIVEFHGEPGQRLREARGVSDVWVQCYALGRLPHELGGVAWAAPGRTVPLPPAENAVVL